MNTSHPKKYQCFRQLQNFRKDKGSKKKEKRFFIIKMIFGSRTFLFRCTENARVFSVFGDLERIREIEGKEEILLIKMVFGSRIFLFRYAENVRVFGAFRELGKDRGSGKKGRDSYD